MMRKKTHFELNQKDLITLFKREQRPLGVNDLYALLGMDKQQRRNLKRILQDLLEKGSIIKLKHGTFGIVEEMNLVRGTLWCTRSGNGFVVPDKEGVRDLFIPARQMNNAFHGDTVIARLQHTSRTHREGRIIEIVRRNTNHIIGFTNIHNKLMYITPEDSRYNCLFVVKKTPDGVKVVNGSLVAAAVTKFPGEQADAECVITKVFEGGLTTVDAITRFVEYKYGLPGRFKKSVDSELKNLEGIIAEQGRTDLTALNHVTIDGESAKDFDDAVYVEKTAKGYTLFVSIADVSSFVSAGSLLDEEAYERGTSIYFPGKVIPMLPKLLSNGLCSLTPGENKQALTVRIDYNRDGDAVRSIFFNSVIRSKRRLTYHQVEDAIIGRDKRTREKLGDLVRLLEDMAELASLLKNKREDRGSLDFDLPEPEIILNIEGGIKEIIRSERLFAHQLIEEFMVAANETVACFLKDNDLPALYRIHEPPDRDKLREIEKLIFALPLHRKKTSGGAASLQLLLMSAKGTDYEFFVNRVLLRSMKQARYSATNKGHFGLASDCYLHFTSPIRRYPDLACHRSLKNMQIRGLNAQGDFEKMAAHLSDRERLAMEAERDLEDRIRILFMKGKIGKTYQGLISHITAYGFFVELNEVFVEGLVLLTDLSDDYYHFQEEKLRLIGKRTRKIYRIGDRINVRVIVADPETNRLHFMPT
ncbi:MAG TPA: ribonuclease R [Syntrophorhabdaceae bacterium]|nr:ribonuclease R [Syntrophorhabdaceae bacterium]